MAVVVSAIDSVVGAVSAGTSVVATSAKKGPEKMWESERNATLGAYVGMGLSTAVVIGFFTDFDFSVVQMLSSFCMLWAFLLLTVKVQCQNSAAGVSCRMLEMKLATLFVRLCSTMIKKGYLPEDKSGDYLYQLLDVAIFFVVLRLVYRMQRQYRQTYQESDDLHGIFYTVPPSIMLAMMFHPHLNRSFLFDTIWTSAQLMETFCMIPQLYMITKQGGKVETYTCQFVVLMFASRCFAWAFWYSGYPELADGYVEGVSAGAFNYGGYLIMLGSTTQVLVSADFIYYYLRAVCSGRAMTMPAASV